MRWRWACGVLVVVASCGGKEGARDSPSDSAPADDASVDETSSDADDDASVDAPPPYPEGPYGLKPGNVYPPYTVKGRHGESGAETTISISDYYDPDGSRGITGLLVTIEAVWCGPCGVWTDQLVHWWPTYSAHGARFVDIMYEDKFDAGGTEATVDAWIAKHHVPFDVISGEPSDAIPSGLVSVPDWFVIDPRTMKIYYTHSGIDDAQKFPCATDVDCCDPATSPGGCGLAYVCSAAYTTCLAPKSLAPIPQLANIMKLDGDPPPLAFP
jgi:hypothetical protein